jgi:hypothetical protein
MPRTSTQGRLGFPWTCLMAHLPPVAGPTRDRRGRIAWGPIAPDLTGKSRNQDLLVLAHTTSPEPDWEPLLRA